jgi:type I restriction enzyme, R subunit
MNLSEALTRIRLIDPQLRQAGWRLDDRTQVRLEIPVDDYDAEPWNGVTDYCLYEPGGQVLGVVEAKRCSRNPREADEQLRHYVTEIAKRQSFAPFGFMTNGHATHFWEVGLANPWLVAGCFTPEDLQRLLFIRQNGQPLAATSINTTIVERPYQHEAIRRVAEAFAANKRRALLVMATGTGKARTTMALIDLFLRAHHNADQIRFLRSVQEVFLKKRSLVEADLYEPPLTVFGRYAVERFFSPQEIRELLELLQTLAA